MKILVVVEKNSWFNWHISASLEEMGHQVQHFYFGNSLCEFYGIKRYQERIKRNKQLVFTIKQMLREDRLDFILCFVQDDFLLPKHARFIEQLDIPFVNYCVDMACQWYRLTQTAKYFTCILCAQPSNMQNMKRYAKKVLYFPMAARKLILTQSTSQFIPDAPVTFLGTPTHYRIQLLATLVHASIPLAVYGKFWKEKLIVSPVRNVEKTLHDLWCYGLVRLKGEGIFSLLDAFKRRLIRENSQNSSLPEKVVREFLPSDAIYELFKKSKINLGFTRIIGDDPYGKGSYQMRLRDFEVPLTGGFYLVEKAPGYETFFTSDKEVVTWTTAKELKEKVIYYLKNEKEREDIAKEGQKRALSEHTWEHRFKMLFQELGIQ